MSKEKITLKGIAKGFFGGLGVAASTLGITLALRYIINEISYENYAENVLEKKVEKVDIDKENNSQDLKLYKSQDGKSAFITSQDMFIADHLDTVGLDRTHNVYWSDKGKNLIEKYDELKNEFVKEYDGYTLEEMTDALIEVESENKKKAKRYEPGKEDSSYGLGQLLTRTALDLEKRTRSLPRISDYETLKEKIDGVEAEKALVELYDNSIRVNGKVNKVKIDGKIDEASRELIKRVQRKHNLSVTGELDKKTLRAVQEERHIQKRLYDSEINREYSKTLFKEELDFYDDPFLAVAAYNSGHLTPRNARIQEKLNHIYGLDLATDGVFGPKTKEVFRRVQEDRNKQLKEGYKIAVDGVYGLQTELAIENMWIYTYLDGTRESYNIIENDLRGSIPQNKYTPNHVRKFKKALARIKQGK